MIEVQVGGVGGARGFSSVDTARWYLGQQRLFETVAQAGEGCGGVTRGAVGQPLMREFSVDSDTMRPPQIEAMRSSLLTTRSRFFIR